MALSHNAFIRGFNSIYQQAPRIQLLADKKDFVGYCIAWVDCVSQHHHYEETELFPALDKAAHKEGLMSGAVDQHGMLRQPAQQRDCFAYLMNS
jgi:hemerythrin-like domain-containing protein